jgi:hypothetical protein
VISHDRDVIEVVGQEHGAVDVRGRRDRQIGRATTRPVHEERGRVEESDEALDSWSILEITHA